MEISDCRTFDDWKDVYKKLVRWELELSSADSNMTEMLSMQKEEANNGFGKFIAKNYLGWIKNNNEGRPLISPEIFKRKIFPR